ncbi:serine hydrolase domain-containing protein [Enterovirga rhinocerotis]|uniref:CubicO group peptidase (Beta-lactamase class C family) n=1 Tax=Enterovirga rhinocerotis TaxID=1339210 RepID=A0A4R7BWW1_9HYPH|nr:serine hydrolase [Enterovirga rhinocerotis]TDR90400.1 CubicO group peptidase (beta-lactamase class C family) [Enterovirga rhinocerotis]
MSTDTVPPRAGEPWPSASPEEAGFDAGRLAEAMRLMQSLETPWPLDLQAKLEAGFFEPPPQNELIGPVSPRGGANAILLRGGRRVASFGDTRRVDMTFSVAKSYLALLAGIAKADGLFGSVDDPIRETVDDGGFEGRNAGITWRHLLQQTSEWEGTLFGKPDTIDRNRVLGIDNTGRPPRDTTRELGAPGSFWEYNDVRVNRLGLSLLRLFKRPLPEVFAERIMAPIGASQDWRWEGYRNSEVEVDGRMMRSVPGGGHWGGGVFIHAEDQARIALLAARDGIWGDLRLLPEGWMAASLEPCALNPNYGFLWWLNTGRIRTPAASEQAFFALGTGGNVSLVEPADDIVLVLRWVDPARLDDVVSAVRGALAR